MRCAMTCALVIAAQSGCFAPHGMAPLPLPMARDSAVVELAGGAAAASGRTAARTELGLGGQVTDWFGLELRGQYLHVVEGHGTDEAGRRSSHTVNAFYPYLRPFFFAAPVTIAVPVSGFAFGAGGGGIAAGLAGASVGFGGPHWNVFTGVQWQAAQVVSSRHSESSVRELCFGARYALLGDYWRVSIDPQLVVSRHYMKYTQDSGNSTVASTSFESDRHFAMGVIQVSVAFGDLKQRSRAQPAAQPRNQTPPATP